MRVIGAPGFGRRWALGARSRAPLRAGNAPGPRGRGRRLGWSTAEATATTVLSASLSLPVQQLWQRYSSLLERDRLEAHVHLRRRARQHLNLIGWALTVNSLTRAEHRARPPGTAAA